MYDADKNLVAAKWCEDVTATFHGCPGNSGIFNSCVQSSGYTPYYLGLDGGLD